MRSTNLAFDFDYLQDREHDRLFHRLTDDYMLVCDNYAVAYKLLPILDKVQLCERSDITDDYYWPYSSVIFFTCRPEDAERIKCVAKRIPSYINANIHVYQYDIETGEDIEI